MFCRPALFSVIASSSEAISCNKSGCIMISILTGSCRALRTCKERSQGLHLKGQYDDNERTGTTREGTGRAAQTASTGTAEAGTGAGGETTTETAGTTETGAGAGGEAKTAPAGAIETGARTGGKAQTAATGAGKTGRAAGIEETVSRFPKL